MSWPILINRGLNQEEVRRERFKEEGRERLSLCNFECTLNKKGKNVNNVFTKGIKSDILITLKRSVSN